MEVPANPEANALKDALHTLFSAIPPADPAQYVRGQYDGYRDIAGVAADSTTETYAALRLDIDNWRWSGVPIFIRTGKRMPVTQTEMRLVFQRPPRVGFHAMRAREPEPMQLVVKLDPATGVRLLVEAQRGHAAEPEQISLDMEFAEEGGEGPTPYEVLLLGRHARRLDALHAPGRRRGDLADHAAAARRAAAGAPVRAGLVGTARRPTGCWPASAAGTSRGWRHDRRRRRGGDRAAERRGALAVPADRAATASSPTATPVRSSRPTAASAGCACRASTRRACSARCSTARPATSASRRSGQRPLQPALRAGDQHPRDDVAHAERLGRRARRADHGAAPRRGHGHAAHAPADRRRRRAPARPHRPLHRRQRRGRARVRAGLRLRPRRRPSGRSSATIATSPTPAGRG